MTNQHQSNVSGIFYSVCSCVPPQGCHAGWMLHFALSGYQAASRRLTRCSVRVRASSTSLTPTSRPRLAFSEAASAPCRRVTSRSASIRRPSNPAWSAALPPRWFDCVQAASDLRAVPRA